MGYPFGQAAYWSVLGVRATADEAASAEHQRAALDGRLYRESVLLNRL
jgi:hypothetical protein